MGEIEQKLTEENQKLRSENYDLKQAVKNREYENCELKSRIHRLEEEKNRLLNVIENVSYMARQK